MATSLQPTQGVEVVAPARLHLGFIDPAGTAGRRFGGVGMAIERPHTRVRLRPSNALRVSGVEVERATRYVTHLLERLHVAPTVAVEVCEAMPAHAGLGSGTQLALALGAAVAAHTGHSLGAARTAEWLDRGGRSGIGVGAFEQGGFLVDGGKRRDGACARPPAIIARAEVPVDWRVLLLFDRAHRGLSGERERAAFRELAKRSPPGVEGHAALVLMGMLPAIEEGDLSAFGGAVSELQERVGDHFAPAQGGRFASPTVTDALAWLRTQQGVSGVGQSSWGPTGFAFCRDDGTAQSLARSLEERLGACAALTVEVATPRNTPARITPIATHHEVDPGVREA